MQKSGMGSWVIVILGQTNNKTLFNLVMYNHFPLIL